MNAFNKSITLCTDTPAQAVSRQSEDIYLIHLPCAYELIYKLPFLYIAEKYDTALIPRAAELFRQ